MTDLSEQSVEDALVAINTLRDDGALNIKPSKLIVSKEAIKFFEAMYPSINIDQQAIDLIFEAWMKSK